MFSVTVTDANGTTTEHSFDAPSILIGKGNDCAIRLSGWRVARTHARIVRTAEGLHLEDLGQMAGTWINGSRVVKHGPLEFSDEIEISGHKIRVRDQDGDALDRGGREVIRSATADGLSAAGAQRAAAVRPATLRGPGGAGDPVAASATPPAKPVSPPVTAQKIDPAAHAAMLSAQVRYPWRKRIHGRLLDTIDLRRRDLTRMSDQELRAETEKLVLEIIAADAEMPKTMDRDALAREVMNEAIGLGPLEELLADETVTEIMVNRHDEIFVERRGRLEWYPIAFTSDRAVMGVIERIVAPLGRRIDESSPMVDARLKDGSRVNAIIPPLALKGPTLTIRKFAKRRLTADDMIGYGSISQPIAEFMKVCVEQRKNIIVAGGTGSGKTTFLNVLSNFIPEGERIITIEDAAELKLHHSHLVSLEARASNAEGRGTVSIRDLVKNALRMRPDRIVVGECRSGEALDMLQAMNTGHEGSLTTLHANTPRDALARLETLVLMAGMDLPLTAIREQIASAVDILIQQTRFPCGSRKVTSVSEVTGMEGDRIQLQELLRFEPRGYDTDGRVRGQFVGCDCVPSFYEEMRERGIEPDLSIFARNRIPGHPRSDQLSNGA